MASQAGFRYFGDDGPCDAADGGLVRETPDCHEEDLDPDCTLEWNEGCDTDHKQGHRESNTAVKSSRSTTESLDEDPADHVAEEHNEGKDDGRVEGVGYGEAAKLEEVGHIADDPADATD